MGEKREQSVLFADVCGSTALFEQLGDIEARALISDVLGRLASITADHDGRVVKTIGDEVMCTLPDASAALRASILMQRAISTDPGFLQKRVAIRVGFHHGQTLAEDGDVFGDAVNVAARMAGLAKREEVVTTAATVAAAGDAALETRALGKIRVKGKLLPIETCEVLWQEDLGGVTVISQVLQVDDDQREEQALELEYGDETWTLKALSPPARLGRDPASKIVVDHDWVSRNHAKIEFRSGGFVIIDRSTNGSFVQTEGEREFCLHRDELRLRSAGRLSLGRSVESTPSEAIVRWRCTGGNA